MAIWPAVKQGDLNAINTMLKLTDVRERIRSRFYLRGPNVVVNQQQTNISSDQGVLVIEGESKESYIAGLRAVRGGAACFARPPAQNELLGVAVRPDLEGAVPGPPGDDALGDAIGDGSIQEPRLTMAKSPSPARRRTSSTSSRRRSADLS